MDKPNQIKIAVFLGAFFLTAGVMAESASVLLEEGIYAEQTEGDLDKAIAIYTEITEQHRDDERIAARATYQLGMCHLKKGEKAQAAAYFRKVVSDYPNQEEIAEQAKQQFSEIYPGQQIVERTVTIARPAVDPAKLMPANTLIYVEIGSPGKQVETIINMLKGTPLENPFALIGGGNGGMSPGNVLGAFFNPSMLAEFKKIRGSAVGITGFATNNPPFVVLLDPGESDALRGLIMAGLGTAGVPGEPIEGMKTLTIQKQIGVAYDEQVIIVAQPLEQLRWSVRQYKGITNEPTLASENKSFSRIAREIRQDNAITTWANVDEVYAGVLKQFPAGQIPRPVQIANAFADFSHIDDYTDYFSIEQDGLRYKVDILFKEGHNCLVYDMIRTPNISKAALQAVPSDAVALASFALSAQDERQAETIRAKIKNVTGLDIGREIFANIEQVTFFAVPPKQARAFIGANMGLVITSHNPQQTREILARILGSVNTMLGGEPMGVVDLSVGQYQVGRFKDNPLYCYVEQVDKATILSMSPEVTKAALDAINNGNNICNSGPLSGYTNKLSENTSKLVLVNAGGVIRLAAGAVIESFQQEQRDELRNNFEQLALATDQTTIELNTQEQLNEFTLNSSVTGMPSLNEVYGPLNQISEIINKAEAKEREKAQVSACIIKTSKAPVIDGTADDVWSQARQYELKNVIYLPISSPEDLAANYRAMWDEENLYMLVDVTDDKLENYTKQWYLDDCIEIFIDADNSKSVKYDENDYQYHFDWDRTNPQMDEDEHHRIQGVEFAMVTTDKGYRTEIKFPWSTLGKKPSAGMKIGLEVHVNDDDNGQRTKLAWRVKQDVASGSPRTWGVAQLAGQIGWWKFDEGLGEVAGESSGSGRDCIISGATWKSGGWDGKGFCLEFGGDGDSVVDDDAGAYLNGLEALTVSVWVKSDQSGTDKGIILFCDPDNVHERGIRYDKQGTYGNGTNVIKCGVTANGESVQMESSNNVQTAEWQHLVMTWSSGNQVQLYINGKLDTPTSSQRARAGALTGSTKLLIGKGCKYGTNSDTTGWDGLIDDVRIYNYVLSDAEIKELAKQ